jgi:predicted nucleic acid-binding protein
MNVLVDTNLLTRAAEPAHPMHEIAARAVAELSRRDERLYLVPQVLVELWVVATRPTGENGLGMEPAAV